MDVSPGQPFQFSRPESRESSNCHEGKEALRSHVFYHSKAVTDAGGRFLIERFPAGKGWIGRQEESLRRPPVDTQEIELQGGKVVEIVLGGGGVDVVGKLEMPLGLDVDFPSCNGSLSMPLVVNLPHDLAPEQRRAWMDAWNKSPEGQEAHAKLRHYSLHVSSAGIVTAENALAQALSKNCHPEA